VLWHLASAFSPFQPLFPTFWPAEHLQLLSPPSLLFSLCCSLPHTCLAGKYSGGDSWDTAGSLGNTTRVWRMRTAFAARAGVSAAACGGARLAPTMTQPAHRAFWGGGQWYLWRGARRRCLPPRLLQHWRWRYIRKPADERAFALAVVHSTIADSFIPDNRLPGLRTVAPALVDLFVMQVNMAVAGLEHGVALRRMRYCSGASSSLPCGSR